MKKYSFSIFCLILIPELLMKNPLEAASIYHNILSQNILLQSNVTNPAHSDNSDFTSIFSLDNAGKLGVA